MPNPLNSLPLPQLFEWLVDASWLQTLVTAARNEDMGDRGDITSNVAVAADRQGRAWFRTRRDGVVAGLPVLAQVIKAYDAQLELQIIGCDGQSVAAGEGLAAIRGPIRAVLAAERVMLNFLTRLSGIATLTQAYVRVAEGTAARIYDTRKTLPGWRGLEKYAVRCGGGYSHRLGLHDAVLIKDNHLARVADGDLGDALRQAVGAARELQPPPSFVEVEVDRLEQLDIALTCDVDIILLDNMGPGDLAEAVARRDRVDRGIQLEASGGVTLENLRSVAEAGVDRIAVGAITHSAPALDIGLDLEDEAESKRS